VCEPHLFTDYLSIPEKGLVPTKRFPEQLKQAVTAVEHLIAAGVSPRNMQVVGDSAGGNLILQLMSHILHPVPDVPLLQLPVRFQGVYLMSPWISFSSKYGSMATNNDSDCISQSALLYWGATVLNGVPESMRHYLEPVEGPDDWFKGISTLTDRLLISAGDAECLRDDIVIMAKRLEVAWMESNGDSPVRRENFQFILQEHGVHDDPHLDFLLGSKSTSSISGTIVDWVGKGFT
jgi:acetyl esterase/lipase